MAKLSRLPMTLHDLWYRWEFASAGKKAARLSIVNGRGKVKHTFYKGNFFWHKCTEMVRSRMTIQRVCNTIDEVYVQGQSLTYVLEQTKRENLPQLRIANL